MEYSKPKKFYYALTRFAAGAVSRFTFKRKYIRNELKGVKGPYVVLANHQAALDFVNLIGITRERMNFVISSAFYNTMPVKGIMDKIGIIPKQQFQASIKVLNQMRTVVEHGGGLVIFPAGLMCEDGISTPMPVSTYNFLKWIKADVYVAKSAGSYFVSPKWAKKKRPGRTIIDVYKLFSREELEEMELEAIKGVVDEALSFDAYREQEKNLIRYRGCDNIEGLENVLYRCPHCGAEFRMRVKDKSTIYCEACGFLHTSDKYGFLHNTGEVGEEIRYVSDWSRLIYEDVKRSIESGELAEISAKGKIMMIDHEKKRFVERGYGELRLTKEHFYLSGTLDGEPLELTVAAAPFASMPFKPGRNVDLQHGEVSYRIELDDGAMAMKLVNVVKAFYEMTASIHAEHHH